MIPVNYNQRKHNRMWKRLEYPFDSLVPAPSSAKQVMKPEVAEAARRELLGVVKRGTCHCRVRRINLKYSLPLPTKIYGA